MTTHQSLAAALLPFALLLGGCSNPAADAPDATVAEAPTNSSAADGDAVATGDRYSFTEDSSIGFVGSKVTGSHQGGFASFDGFIELVGNDPAASRVEVTIDTTSIWADNERLLGHLRSDDFFSVETFPTATFRSSAIHQAAEGAFTVTGTLELHGVTKEITFPAAILIENNSVAVQAEFSLNRFDFGLEYPGKADDLIRPEVLLQLDLQALSEAAVSEPEEPV